MGDSDRDVMYQLIGLTQLQAAMFQGLLQVLRERGLLSHIEETDIFNIAEMRLRAGPDTPARDYANTVLGEWRGQGLIMGRPRNLS